MSDIDIITCGLAVIAALKLFVLQPWSSTSMSHLVNIGFGVSAVEIMFTVLPLVNTTPSMISWLPSLMSQYPLASKEAHTVFFTDGICGSWRLLFSRQLQVATKASEGYGDR